MLEAIIESFGIAFAYVTIVGIVSTAWDLVIKAFTRGY